MTGQGHLIGLVRQLEQGQIPSCMKLDADEVLGLDTSHCSDNLRDILEENALVCIVCLITTMDPGTALAIVGLVLDGVKDVYAYYNTWKDRDQEVAEVRSALLWLIGLFQSIKITLANKSLDKAKVGMICDSVRECQAVMVKLRKRLSKVKSEAPPDNFMAKLSDQGRRAIYPFQKGTIVRLLESTEKIRDQMHVVIALLHLLRLSNPDTERLI
ncbi:hypothetical protein DL98DRAFT_575715 [Cadophora sp. DSE1049]|nr:hypothetical protein DL98DRAFT_575715 [Cadophora sp. DSE1049]